MKGPLHYYISDETNVFPKYAILSNCIALLYYLSYNIKGNKVKLYICSYNVYALGFRCNISSVNGKHFFKT